MKNKEVRGILALAVVTALSFGVILGSNALAKDTQEGESQEPAQGMEELTVTDAENVEKAYRTEDGYLVTVKEAGYGGDMELDISFGEDKSTITKVEVTQQSETEGVGTKITEPDFLGQFEGVQAPVYLEGRNAQAKDETGGDKIASDEQEESVGAVPQDGTYEAKAREADENGYTGQVSMTVQDGKITEVNWDCVDAQGNKKSVLSEKGEYVMTEDGLTWAEQSEALAKAVIENQSLNFLTMDEQGKTDAVSGVSINISQFVDLAGQCLVQAGADAPEVSPEAALEDQIPLEGTKVDAVSGATVSSEAAVRGINHAYEFLKTVE